MRGQPGHCAPSERPYLLDSVFFAKKKKTFLWPWAPLKSQTSLDCILWAAECWSISGGGPDCCPIWDETRTPRGECRPPAFLLFLSLPLPHCRWQTELHSWSQWGFPGGSDGKESACHAGNMGSIPGLGRSPGEGNGYPLQYSCLGNSMDRGASQWH